MRLLTRSKALQEQILEPEALRALSELLQLTLTKYFVQDAPHLLEMLTELASICLRLTSNPARRER